MMKTQLLIAVAAVGLITTALKAQADDPVWGPGGYANSLSRVQAKGMAAEQRAATLEANWLQANEGHIKKLLEWLRSNNKLRDWDTDLSSSCFWVDAPMNARLRESYRLALRTGEQNLIAEAKASLAMVAGFGK